MLTPILLNDSFSHRIEINNKVQFELLSWMHDVCADYSTLPLAPCLINDSKLDRFLFINENIYLLHTSFFIFSIP